MELNVKHEIDWSVFTRSGKKQKKPKKLHKYNFKLPD